MERLNSESLRVQTFDTSHRNASNKAPVMCFVVALVFGCVSRSALEADLSVCALNGIPDFDSPFVHHLAVAALASILLRF
jgi:hypothetical protein